MNDDNTASARSAAIQPDSDASDIVLARYGDIINLPHHRSPIRQAMSAESRAAQFAPFAALKSSDPNDVEESSDQLTMLSHDDAVRLSYRLTMLAGSLDTPQTVAVTWVQINPETGESRIMDDDVTVASYDFHSLILSDGRTLPVETLLHLDGPLFHSHPS